MRESRVIDRSATIPLHAPCACSTWRRNKNIWRAFARKRAILRVAAHPVCVATRRTPLAKRSEDCEAENQPVSTASFSPLEPHSAECFRDGIALMAFVARSTPARAMFRQARTYV